MSVIPLRQVNPETEFLRCTNHPQCLGPRLRDDHDDVCETGDECDSDECWRGCKYCIPVGSEN